MSKPDAKRRRKKKKRTKGKARREFDEEETGGGGGAMQGMVGGFKKAVGVGDGKKQKSKVLDRLLTVALVVMAAFVLYRQCG